ncbi:MAG TPA: hypothetical protein VF116_03555 [Ktedonobacterales bacterium]
MRAGDRRGASISLLAALALALGLVIALAVSAPMSHAAPRAATDPAGSINGIVTNGTHNGAPAAGQQVTLRAIVLDRPHDAGTITTDAQGRFAFGNLDTSGETTYEVYTRHQGGFFISAPVSFGGSAAASQTANLAIYDTTSDMSALRVSSLALLISPVNKDKGLIPVGAFYTFANTGTRAITGSLTAPASGSMPQGILRFALPTSASDLTLGAGFADAQTVQISTGFAATATILPGTSSFAFAYNLPYTGTSATLPVSTLYPTDRVTVLAPSAYRLTAPGFATDTPITANGQQFQQLHVDNLATGAAKQVTLGALPEAGVDPDLRFGQVVPIAAVLTGLLALLLWLFSLRGNLGALARLAGRSPGARRVTRQAQAKARAEARNASRQRLLEALLDLDERHTAGAIGDAVYERRRAALRGELRALLAAGALTPRPPLPARRGGGRQVTEHAEGAEARGERGAREKSTTEATEETEERAEAIPAEGVEDRSVESVSVRAHGAHPDQLNADGDPEGASGGRPPGNADSVGASGGRPPAATTKHQPAGAPARSVRARRSRSRATAGGGR